MAAVFHFHWYILVFLIVMLPSILLIKLHHNIGKKPLCYICYSQISNLWQVFKLFNQIISWLARFKTTPVYAKSKSGSVSQRACEPAHVLDSLPPRVHGEWFFTCTCADKSYWKEAVKQSGNKASRFLYLLVSQVRPKQCQRGSISISNQRWHWLVENFLI